MSATRVPWYVLRGNTGVSKHGHPVFPHFCPLNQNLARVSKSVGGGGDFGNHLNTSFGFLRCTRCREYLPHGMAMGPSVGVEAATQRPCASCHGYTVAVSPIPAPPEGYHKVY